MNETFDPARSAAIRAMLVRTAAQDADATPRARGRRIALIASLSAIAVVLAGGTTAWALGVRPFPVAAPKPTPTHTQATVVRPTPTPTPTTTMDPALSFDPPVSRIGLDCAKIPSQAALEGVVPDAKLSEQPAVAPLNYAALRQTGAESCFWDDSKYHLLSLDVSTDVSKGRSDIAHANSQGYGSLHIGNASSAECNKVNQGCSVSLVTGGYWINLNYENAVKEPTAFSTTLRSLVQSIVTRLGANPPKPAKWVEPKTSWATFAGCSDLKSATVPMRTAVGLKVQQSSKYLRGAEDGIQYFVPRFFSCNWSISTGIPANGARAVGLDIVVGGRWAYDQSTAGGHPAKVPGADDAETHCLTSGEDYGCYLDVLSDNTWLRLTLQESLADLPRQKAQLIAAATVILKAHDK